MTLPVTVVIPSYNRKHILEHTLCYYIALNLPVIVVDDGSDDGTSAWLKTKGIEVHRHERQRGPSAARNTGLQQAKTPWVWFGEDDVIFPDNHVALLLQATKGCGESVGAVAGALYPGSTWELPEHRPENPGPTVNKRRLLIDFSANSGLLLPLPTLHGCGLFHRERILAVGGFDEAYTNGSFREESEGYARLWKAGYTCYLATDAWAIHVRHRLGGGCRGGPGLLAKLINRWSYWRNDMRYIWRHHDLWNAQFPGIATKLTIAVLSAWFIFWNAVRAWLR